MANITKAQRRIIREIDEITSDLGLDHRVLLAGWEGHEFFTTMLEQTKRELISAAIVHEYTFFDEILGTIIARYFFGRGGGKSLWRTKRFQRFNHFVLERLFVQQKLALVRDIRPLPTSVVAYVNKLNDLRNAVAHSFFPENLRGNRVTYKGLDIFSIGGFSKLRSDREPVVSLLMRRAYGLSN